MKYRFPFTPYPKGWYRVTSKNKTIHAFGKKLQLEETNKQFISRDYKMNASFPTLKKNGHFFVFFDEKNNAPYFEVPEIPEFSDKQWQKPFYLTWRTKSHLQEVAENALDLSHFCTVHTYDYVPELSQFKIFGHQFNVVMHSQRKVMGLRTKTSMDITYHGMGIVVANVISRHATLKVLLTTTPITQDNIDIHMSVAIKKTSNPFKNLLMRTLLPSEVYKEFSHDIPVWEGKIYRQAPLLCQNEANIIRIRKWAKQFYE